MTTSDGDDQQARTIAASVGRSFNFEQGASLHVGMLGMVGRPSGPHDEAPYFRGTWRDARSQGQLDLSQVQPEAGPDEPELHLWFDEQRTMLDISEAFAGAPAEALEGSGIPAAVIHGPVVVERSGDAGDGVMALLTQICGGKIAVDPYAMLRLIASEHVAAFAEHEVEDQPGLRAFNATVSLHYFLAEMGLTSTTLVNQIAVLGYDLRSEAGPEVVAMFAEHLHNNAVQLAWFVDEQDRIHTMQAIITLTAFIDALLTSDDMVEQMAREESCSVKEMREVVDKYVEAGRLVYVHAIWQTIEFAVGSDNEVTLDDVILGEVIWPEATDLTEAMALQASRLSEQAAASPSGPAPASSAAPVTGTPDAVSVDSQMIETMQASSGAMHFVLSDVDGDAVAAMQAAQTALMDVGHPDEPDEALASFLSDVIETDSGAHFWADISDMEEETNVLEAVLAAVVNGVAGHVKSAHLSGQKPN